MIDANQYDSLQSAVNTAIRQGQRLLISPGTYNENIVIAPQQYAYVVLDMYGEGAGFGNMPCVTINGSLDIVSGRNIKISGVKVAGHGITIDPVGTVNGSSQIELFEVQVTDPGECALNVSPGTSQNADRITLRRFWAQNGKYGISINQSQARAFDMYSCSFDLFDTVLVSAYGRRQGSAPNWYGGQVGRCRQLLDFPSAFGHPLRIDGVHIESTHGIGNWGQGKASSRQTAIFTGGFIDLSMGGVEPVGYVGPPAMISFAPVKFDGTSFRLRSENTFEGPDGFYTFDSTTSYRKPIINAPHEYRANCYSWA